MSRRLCSLVTLPAENTGPDQHVKHHDITDVPWRLVGKEEQAGGHQWHGQRHADLDHDAAASGCPG